MELAKFIFQGITTAITLALFFAGIWRSYAKKIEAEIKALKEASSESKKLVEKELEDYQTKTDESLKELWCEMRKTQSLFTENYQRRLSSIEGELKGIKNVVTQIQSWFIANTPTK